MLATAKHVLLIIVTDTTCDWGQDYCWLITLRQRAASLNMRTGWGQKGEDELGAFGEGWTHAWAEVMRRLTDGVSWFQPQIREEQKHCILLRHVIMDVLCHLILIKDGSTHGRVALALRPHSCAICAQCLASRVEITGVSYAHASSLSLHIISNATNAKDSFGSSVLFQIVPTTPSKNSTDQSLILD
jgi:hypothetical protein